MSSITELRDTLIALQPPPDDGSGRAVVERLDELRVLRNVLDHQIAVHIALLEDSGAPARAGSTTRSWLIEMGLPPTAAHRGARIAAGLGSLPKVADCAADGYLAIECVDAVVRGIARRARTVHAPEWVGPLVPLRALAQRVVERNGGASRSRARSIGSAWTASRCRCGCRERGRCRESVSPSRNRQNGWTFLS